MFLIFSINQENYFPIYSQLYPSFILKSTQENNLFPGGKKIKLEYWTEQIKPFTKAQISFN